MTESFISQPIHWLCILCALLCLISAVTADDPYVGWTNRTCSIGAIHNISPGPSMGPPDNAVHWIYGGGYKGWYRSDNEGISWEHLGTSEPNAANFNYVISSSDPAPILYAGSYGNAIRISENNGDTWQVFDDFDRVCMESGIVNPSNPREAFIALAHNGVAWINSVDDAFEIDTISTNTHVFDLIMDPEDTNTVYVATNNAGVCNMVRKIGNSWQFNTPTIPSPFQKTTALCHDPYNANVIYAGSYDEATNDGSTGKVWKGVINTSQQTIDWSELPNLTFTTRIDALICPPTNLGNLLVATKGQIHRYDAASESWADMEIPIQYGTKIYSMVVSDSTENLIVGTDAGCMVYVTPLNLWERRNSGLRNTLVNKILSHPTNNTLMVAATEGNGVFCSHNSGKTWLSANPGLSSLYVRDIVRDPNSPLTLYAVHLNGFARSSDNGLTWTEPDSLPPDLYDTSIQIERIIALNNNGNTVLLAGVRDGSLTAPIATIYRSTNHGDTWTPVPAPSNNHTIRELVSHPTQPGIVYACCDNNQTWKSIDWGESFISWNAAGLGQKITQIVFNPSDPSHMLAASASSGVYRSTDSGATFQECDGTGSHPWSAIAFNPIDSSQVFIASDEPIYAPGGLKVSNDDGATFFAIQQELRTNALPWLHSDPEHQRLQLYDVIGNRYALNLETGTWQSQPNVFIQLPFVINDYQHDPINPDIIYAASHGYGVWRSSDGGLTWEARNDGLKDHLFIYSLDIDKRDTTRLLAGAAATEFGPNTLFQTQGPNIIWTQTGSSVTGYGSIVDIEILDTRPEQQEIWLAAYSEGVLRSIDDGNNWESIAFSDSPPGQFITSVTHTYYESQEEPWIHVASHGGEGAFIYNPDTQLLLANNTGLPRHPLTDEIYVDRIFTPSDSTAILYAALTNGALYISMDNGNSWQLENAGSHTNGWAITPELTRLHYQNYATAFRQSDIDSINGILVHASAISGAYVKTEATPWEQLPPATSTAEPPAYSFSLGLFLRQGYLCVMQGATTTTQPFELAEQQSVILPLTPPSPTPLPQPATPQPPHPPTQLSLESESKTCKEIDAAGF